MLSSLQHFLQNRRLKLPGQGGDGKGCCKIKALIPFPSLLRAPSQAARVCLQHSSPLSSCTKRMCAKKQALNLAEGFQSIQLTEFDMQIAVKYRSHKYTRLHVSDEDFHPLVPSIRTLQLS